VGFDPSSISVAIATPLRLLLWKPGGTAFTTQSQYLVCDGLTKKASQRLNQEFILTALTWAAFSSGLAFGSNLKAVTPAFLLSSTIVF
jgi:hypothetical protein